VEFFSDVPEPVAFAGTNPGPNGLGYQVYDPARTVAGKRMEPSIARGWSRGLIP